MKTSLVSFADGPFSGRAAPFADEARAFGAFDSVEVHNQNTLPHSFVSAHGAFMSRETRGHGYWIWKPQVILNGLDRLEAGDCLVYMDAGYSLNLAGKPRFKEYLELACDSEWRMLSFQNIHTEAHWTKADLAQRLGLSITSSHMKTSQLGSGLIVLQKTPSNIDLVREWASLAVEQNYSFSDDSPSQTDNHSLFREHRHDQSIASLLRKMRGSEVTHYEVHAYLGAFERHKANLPFWATRLRK